MLSVGWRIGLFLYLLASAALVQAEVAVPPLQSRVTDLTATFSAEQRGQLESMLDAFEARKGSQIAVLLVPSTQPETIEQYGIRVAEKWKLGRKGIDDGALLILAKQDHAVRVEVGYGLEGVIPDAIAKRIVSETIIPRLKRDDYFGGVKAGVEAMIEAVDGEALPAPSGRTAPGHSPGSFLYFLFFVIAIASFLRSLLGLVGVLLAGGVAGVLAWLAFGSLIAAAIAAVITVIFAFGRFGTGIPGGFGGSGGSGGFSGGGGGFGGGGASGRW